jgi:hypothetical protein
MFGRICVKCVDEVARYHCLDSVDVGTVRRSGRLDWPTQAGLCSAHKSSIHLMLRTLGELAQAVTRLATTNGYQLFSLIELVSSIWAPS